MTLTMSPDLQRAIYAHGEAAYPNEGAGLLLGQADDGRKALIDIMPLANEWTQASSIIAI